MKKNFRYIIDTLLCRFSKHFVLKNAKTKWLTYQLGSVKEDNTVTIEDSRVSHSCFYVSGNHNKVCIKNHAGIAYSNIKIDGSNCEVILDGCRGIVSLIIRGNGCRVTIGKDTSMEDLYIVCMEDNNFIIVGDNCMFSGDVEIWNSDTHLITDLDGNGINAHSSSVTIGNHVWLGKHAKILKGVSIGDNAIIGMSSVVTKKVPSQSIAAGNPACIVKEGITWEKGFIQ